MTALEFSENNSFRQLNRKKSIRTSITIFVFVTLVTTCLVALDFLGAVATYIVLTMFVLYFVIDYLWYRAALRKPLNHLKLSQTGLSLNHLQEIYYSELVGVTIEKDRIGTFYRIIVETNFNQSIQLRGFNDMETIYQELKTRIPADN